MGLTAKKTGGVDFEPTPAGLFHTICYGVVDIGTHTKNFQGSEYDAHEVILIWEIPECRIEIEKDGELKDLPRVISKRYTLSLSPKSNLYKDLVTWRGKQFTDEELEGFDLKKLLEANCQLNVIHTKKNDKTYANVGNIVPAPKDSKGKPVKRKAENPLLYFSFEDLNVDEEIEIPDAMPDWIKSLIQDSHEWDLLNGTREGIEKRQEKEEELAGKPAENIEDDLPF